MMRGFFSIAFIFIMNVPVFAQLSKVHYLPPVAFSSETGSNAIPINGQNFISQRPAQLQSPSISTPLVVQLLPWKFQMHFHQSLRLTSQVVLMNHR